MLSQKSIGRFQVIMSGVCFGFLGLFGKWAFEAKINYGEFLSIRFFFSAVILFFFLLLTRPRSLVIERVAFVKNILLGIFGLACFSSLFFYTLTGLSASLTVLLLYLYPGFVALGGVIIFKERLTQGSIVALLASLVGSSFLVWGEWAASRPFFLITGFLSAIFYAGYILFSRAWLKNQDSIVSIFYIQLSTSLALGFFHFENLATPVAILTRNFWLLVGVAVICTVFAMTLFLAGLKKVNAVEASILSTTEPLVGVLVAALVMGEKLSWIQAIGGMLILFGVVAVSLSDKERRVTNA